MTDENSRYHSILTDVGIDKQAAADAEGIPWKLAKMAVGDGGDILEPVPDPGQIGLFNERYRALLNSLIKDPVNPGTWIAELVIPLDVGGWWVRELGLYDADDDLVAVANCPPSYKPLPSQGSVRTQRVRMRFVISNSGQVELIVSDDIVFATPDYVDQKIQEELNKQDFKHSVLVATTGPIELTGVQTIDDVAVLAGSRVLVKDQVEGKDNGLYLTAEGVWGRTADADSSIEITPGLLVHVERGMANGNTLWHLITDAPIILGTTALTFQWAGGQYVPTPGMDDRSKRVANTESVRVQIESPNQKFPEQVYRKNLLINGNFDIWQRGDSGSVSAASAVYAADRWMVFVPEGVTAQWAKIPFVLGAGFNGASWALSASYSEGVLGSNVRQRIEGVETGSGSTLTVSFYMKSTVNQTCTVVLRQVFGTGGNVSADVDHFQDIDVTSEYKQHVASFNLSSVLGKTKGYNKNDYIELIIVSKVAVAHTVVVASAQLEIGGVATDFDSHCPQQELTLCQRYFEKTFSQHIAPVDGVDISGSLISVVFEGQSGSSSQPVSSWQFKVEKRSTPSIRLYRPMGSGADGQWRSGSDLLSSANARSLIAGTCGVSIDNSDVGLSSQTYYIHATADAEL